MAQTNNANDDAKTYTPATFDTVDTITLGGGWGYAVGLVDDGRTIRIRIAKGRFRKDIPESDDDDPLAHLVCPVMQTNKINLRHRHNWEALKALVDEAFDRLESLN